MRGRVVLVPIALLALAGCGRQAEQKDSTAAPAVAPVSATPPSTTKHYTAADFAAACYPYPSDATLQQYAQVAHLTGQDAIDYEYKQQASVAPNGECSSKPIKPAASTNPPQQQGGWTENARANDMAHYGDALPGGKN